MCGIFLTDEPHTRKPRIARDRDSALAFVQTFSDDVFKNHFRVTRETFNEIVSRMITVYPGKQGSGILNYERALLRGKCSTPCSGATTLELKLCVTLRLLAGASHCDMIWFGVQTGSVHNIFHSTLKLINAAYPNEEIFNFNPEGDKVKFEEEVERMSNEWASIMQAKRGHRFFEGTILAGDGLVVPIKAPTSFDRKGGDIGMYRNRKGCFALIVAAFCDAFCRFRYFEVSWPGSTNDITAYQQTNLYRMFTKAMIPTKYHMVLDEAYGGIGGEFHLTPFTRSQLRKARRESVTKYKKMKSFNHFLSSQRITIERCFGMFVRKFGILWKTLDYSLSTNTLILQVCAKLHNLCINHWMKAGDRATEIQKIDNDFRLQNDARIFTNTTSGRERNTVDDVRKKVLGMSNSNDTEDRPLASARRWEIAEDLYDKGIRYDTRADNDFTLTDANDVFI